MGKQDDQSCRYHESQLQLQLVGALGLKAESETQEVGVAS